MKTHNMFLKKRMNALCLSKKKKNVSWKIIDNMMIYII